ncbi:Hypothetical protein BQ3484_117 [Cedratvirus A11]|uniref:Uncharacterized protein n=1 Tax=Cedratvirus A11 TaxID=1903266 RepID=A0A1M7XU35_9VIRU|nr:Hypothetical protein BQ3484_117 [Cedratvirus A11]SHO33185.1 Hypothetical protein BQ3484_117 [Cedratvirus A11]
MSYTSGYGDARTAGLSSGYGLGGPLSPRGTRYTSQQVTDLLPLSPRGTRRTSQQAPLSPRTRLARYGNQDNITTETVETTTYTQQAPLSPRTRQTSTLSPRTRYGQQVTYDSTLSPRGTRYTTPRYTYQQSDYSPRGTLYSPRGTRYNQSDYYGSYGQGTR